MWRRMNARAAPGRASHERARVGEAPEIADLRHQCDRGQRRHAAPGLESRDDPAQGPAWQQGHHLLLQAIPARLSLLDGLDQLFEHDLLGGMLEPLFGQPSAMGACPMAPGRISASMPQQEGQQLLPRPPQSFHRGLPSPRQVAHRLVGRVRHPDRRQLAGAEQRGQGRRIATVGLDVPTRPHRHHRRRHHLAVVAHRTDLAVKPVPRGTGFIAEGEPPVLPCQLLHQLAHRLRPAGDGAEQAHLPAPATLRNRHRKRLCSYRMPRMSYPGSWLVSHA